MHNNNNNYMKLKRTLICLVFAAMVQTSFAQSGPLTREQILSMSSDELSELPLEDLMQAVETLGVSSVDELFALIMNKNVSSASKSDESSFTSPLATTVLTKDELRTYGATTLEDAFRLIPGMIVSQKYNGVYDIHMRGLNNLPDNNSLLYTENNNTLLMVDGRIVQNYITGAVYMDRLPISIEDVDRIEVVRGACSALYGMNAVNGVINIITEKPSSGSNAVSGSVQIGNLSTYVADVAVRKALNDKWSLGVSVNAQHRGRPTSKIFVAPAENLYVANDKAGYSSLINVQGGSSASSREELLANNARHLDVEGEYLTSNEIDNLVVAKTETNYATNESKYYFYRGTEQYASIYEMFKQPEIARKNVGINAYLRFQPQPDITFDLSGGYQNSYAVNSPILQYAFTMVGQKSKTGYVNLDASIKDFHFLGNISSGPQNLAVGAGGFKTKGNNINLQAEYDIQAGDKLMIRPGVAFQRLHYKDYDQYYEGTALSGFFNDEGELSTVSPNLRLDFKSNGWRLIAGVRGDKTSAPDKWNVSMQGVVSKQINDNNFIRLTYGRAFRAPNMINTATSYVWDRSRMDTPYEMRYLGSTEADLLKIDNFELGYRWKPTEKILLDAEFYFSMSKDYGALMASSSVYTVSQEAFASGLTNMLSQGMGGGMTPPGGTGGGPGMGSKTGADDKTDKISRTVSSMIRNSTSNYTNVVYQNLPYEVKQVGLSLNLDWIVSPKLIVKVNANLQKTLVDNYYVYNQAVEMARQLDNARYATTMALSEIFDGVTTEDESGNLSMNAAYMAAAFGKAYMDEFKAQSGWDNWDYSKQDDFMRALLEAYEKGETTVSYDGGTYTGLPLSLYYGLQYNVHQVIGRDGSPVYEIGESSALDYERSNGHVHKSTPAVYGMVGLVYKPLKQLTVSAYGNYMHHRTYGNSFSNVFTQMANDKRNGHVEDMESLIKWNELSEEDAEIYKQLVKDNDQMLVDAQKYDDMAKKANKVHSKFSLNMKVGYSPMQNVEFFLNAQNMFNTNVREHIYSDKIGGLYTLGVNFGF